MHVLAELTAYHDRHKWSEEVFLARVRCTTRIYSFVLKVCASIISLGGVRPVLEHLGPVCAATLIAGILIHEIRDDMNIM